MSEWHTATFPGGVPVPKVSARPEVWQRHRRCRSLDALACGAAALVLRAAPTDAAPKSGDPAGRTVVHFDGDTIDGDLMRPDGDLVSARAAIPMPSLVAPPRSFERASRRTLLSAAAALERAPVNQTPKDHGTEGADVGRGARSTSRTR